jgi:hypothetical protein
MFVLNNLNYKGGKTTFHSGLTYRKGKQFISELDLCLANKEMIPLVDTLNISQESLPSDHLPVCVTLDITKCVSDRLKEIERAASELGEHAVMCREIKRNVCKKSTKHVNIDKDLFQQRLREQDLPPTMDPADISDIMYDLAKQSIQNVEHNEYQENNHSERWHNILARKDSRAIWSAINWKGEANSNQSGGPKSDDFKIHFEKLLNPERRDQAEMARSVSNVQISILDDPISPTEVQEAISKQMLWSY